jgi:hypothetical protein
MAKSKGFKKIQDIFTGLEPYILSISLNTDFLSSEIEEDEDPNYLRFDIITLFPNTWEINDHNDFLFFEIDVYETSTKYRFINENKELIVDDLLNYIQEIINHNIELETKRKKLEELIEKERQAFEAKIEKLKNEI